MITLLRLRKRNLSKEPVPVLDSGGICITSRGRGSIWTIASGLRLSETGRLGNAEGWRRAFGPSGGGFEAGRANNCWDNGHAMANCNGKVASDTGPASFARNRQMEQAWGNACTGVC